MMYAEVYRWFTETSGLGPADQAAQLMNPKAAAKEEDIANAIELWEERCNRLARHGSDYTMAPRSKRSPLKRCLWARRLRRMSSGRRRNSDSRSSSSAQRTSREPRSSTPMLPVVVRESPLVRPRRRRRHGATTVTTHKGKKTPTPSIRRIRIRIGGRRRGTRREIKVVEKEEVGAKEAKGMEKVEKEAPPVRRPKEGALHLQSRNEQPFLPPSGVGG